MQIWLDNISKFRSERTVQHYLRAVNYYIESVGNHPIAEFKKHYQERLKTYLECQKLALATQKTCIVEIQCFFNWAFEEEYIDRQIRLSKPRVTKREPEIYSQEDLYRLEKKIDEKYRTAKSGYQKMCFCNHKHALIMLKETAMRGGEVWSLLLENIRLDERLILLRDNQEIDWRIKNRNEDSVPISEQLAEFLRKDLTHRPKSERWYLDNGKGELLYASAGELTKAFKRHCNELGIAGVKPLHGIRATVITRLLEMGVDVSIAKKLARHQNISTTMGYVRTQNLPVK